MANGGYDSETSLFCAICAGATECNNRPDSTAINTRSLSFTYMFLFSYAVLGDAQGLNRTWATDDQQRAAIETLGALYLSQVLVTMS